MVTTAPPFCEPFIAGRDTGRLLFDLGAMLSLLKPDQLASEFLDFAAGSCWITEFMARMGHKVTAYDIHSDLKGCIEGRVSSDSRLDPALISHATGDGHHMPFPDGSFGHVLCYDSLHHMHDFDKVFRELFRVLRSGGRAIFVEPGAKHSSSPETIEFMRSKKHDASWIERDIILEEIESTATSAGFNGLRLAAIPSPHDLSHDAMKLKKWLRFRNGGRFLRAAFSDKLFKVNYNDRVLFFVDKT